MTIRNNRSKLKIAGERSWDFTIKRRLKQGNTLSCVLFNLTLERVVRKISHNSGETLLSRSAHYLAYAHDVDLLARSERDSKLEIEHTSAFSTCWNHNSCHEEPKPEYNAQFSDHWWCMEVGKDRKRWATSQLVVPYRTKESGGYMPTTKYWRGANTCCSDKSSTPVPKRREIKVHIITKVNSTHIKIIENHTEVLYNNQ